MRALPPLSRQQRYLLGLTEQGPYACSPKGMHAKTLSALERRGLVNQLPSGTWAITAKGSVSLGFAPGG